MEEHHVTLLMAGFSKHSKSTSDLEWSEIGLRYATKSENVLAQTTSSGRTMVSENSNAFRVRYVEELQIRLVSRHNLQKTC